MVNQYSTLCSLKRLLFAFALVGLIQVAANAQLDSGRAANNSNGEARTASSAKAGDEVDERLKVLEDQLREQGRRLTDMNAIITEQQRVIAALSAKADEPKNPGLGAVATVATVSDPSVSTSPTQTQTPTMDDRVKKLENKVLAIGPFRL